jgi:hypothetical protein
MANDETDDEHVKEVYARFGLALYFAQVLEHGIVNALVILDLIPSRRHTARSAAEWGDVVDQFMSQHFEDTMGRMIRDLRAVTNVPQDLEGLLRDALKRRNWLAHHFFRERASEFMSARGRDLMIREVEECRAAFELADERLDQIVRPVRIGAGLTDQMLEHVFDSMKAEAEHAG